MKKGWSLYTRTLLLGLGPVLLVSLILSSYFIHARIKDVKQELDNKGQLIAVQLASTADYFVLTGNNSIISPLTRVLLEDKDVEFIEIEDMSGSLLFSQSDQDIGIDQSSDDMKGLLRWFQADIIQYNVLADEEDWFGHSAEEKVLGQVRIGLSEAFIIERQQEILLHAILIGCMAMLISGLIAWLSGAKISRPITVLSETVEKMREGDYSVRTHENASGEVGQLQVGVNTLAGALQKSEEIQQHYVESLIKAREASEAANKAKSEFLAVMTHELRTPMNGVLGMLQLMQTTDLSEEQNDYVETALTSGDHLLGLINDILDFSKIEQGNIELETRFFNLHESLYRVAESFKVVAQAKGLDFQLKIDEVSNLDVKTDETRMRQVLVNLLGNAVKFTDSGFIELAVVSMKIQGDLANIEIMVKDSGKGIGKENLNRIFDAFQQEDASISRRYGGTGLGLAISRQLVDKMGGQLRVESEIGIGSAFKCAFSLPYREHGKRQLPVADTVTNDISDSFNAHVLLVEDNEVNQKVALRMLTHFGVQCELAADGIEAIELCKKQSFDMILMDLQMPNMDGYEATKIIRSQDGSNKETPIIALTANAFHDVKGECLKAGMNDFLAKPYKKIGLHDLLRRWLNEKSIS